MENWNKFTHDHPLYFILSSFAYVDEYRKNRKTFVIHAFFCALFTVVGFCLEKEAKKNAYLCIYINTLIFIYCWGGFANVHIYIYVCGQSGKTKYKWIFSFKNTVENIV